MERTICQLQYSRSGLRRPRYCGVLPPPSSRCGAVVDADWSAHFIGRLIPRSRSEPPLHGWLETGATPSEALTFLAEETVLMAIGKDEELREEVQRLQAEVQRLQTALQDILALAHSAGDLRQRVVMMQRRASAAFSGKDPPQASRREDSPPPVSPG